MQHKVHTKNYLKFIYGLFIKKFFYFRFQLKLKITNQITNKMNSETENKRQRLNQILTELSSLSDSVRSYIAVIQRVVKDFLFRVMQHTHFQSNRLR